MTRKSRFTAAFCIILIVDAVEAVCLLERGDFVDYGNHNVKALGNCIRREALRQIPPGVIIIGQRRVLCRKSDGLDTGTGHRCAVAAANRVFHRIALGLADNAFFCKGDRKSS